jgi:hypothetical protein
MNPARKHRSPPIPAFYGRDGRPLVSTDNCFKMWITQQGEVKRLPSYHRDYIEAHAAEHGVTITRQGDEMRLDGIEAGLFRGNYEFGNGHLTFEGQKRHLTPIMKNALYRLISKNLEHLGVVSINLLNDRNNCVVEAEVPLTQIDSRSARLAAIPFIQPQT